VSLLHGLLAYALAAGTLVMVATGVAAAAVGPRSRIWLDRLILGTLGLWLLAAATGLPLMLVRPPTDPLHLVYGVAAPLILLGGRYLGRGASVRRRAVLVAVASVALLGVIYRLFTTAGGAA